MRYENVDLNLMNEKPQFWVCRPNKKRIDKLKDIYNENLATKENALHELSFTIPVEVERNHELVENPLLEKLKGHYLVEMFWNNKTEYFLLTNSSGSLSNDGVEKTFTLYSYAHKLAKKPVRNYTPEQPQNLTKYVTDFLSETSWSVGSVDVDFDMKYRSFEVSTSSVLQCLFDIAEKFDAMIEFNTVTKRVEFYKVDRGMNRGLRFKEGIYLESFDVQYDFDTIVTRLECYGQDGLEFRSLSPVGSNYIQDFSWYMYPFECDENYNVIQRSNHMSNELCIALTKYNKLLSDNDGTFNDLVELRTNLQAQLTVLNEDMNTLTNDLKVLHNELDVINSTYGDTATSREDYQTCIANINSKQNEINNKQIEIDNKQSEIDTVDSDFTNLRTLLSTENNFTADELLELDDFDYVEEYTNDSITNEEDLLEESLRAFEELKSPTVSLSIGLTNFLNSIENDSNRNKLILGDTVRFKSEKLKVELTSRISEINYNFGNNDVSVTITNAKDSNDEYSRVEKMIYGSATTSNTVNMDKFKWNKAVTQSDDVSKILNNTFDATLQGIKGGVNSNIFFNERGMFSEDIAAPNNMLVINGGQLAISDDGLQSVKVAINKDGVFADKLVGRMILGNKLHIEDDLGIVKIESGTATFYNDSEKVTAQLGKYVNPDDPSTFKYGLYIPDGSIDIRTNTDSLKGIQFDINGLRSYNNNGVKTVDIDSATGKLTILGSFELKTSTLNNRGITFDGNGISAHNASGTRTFYVDTNGNLTASSVNLTGTINATGGTISGNMTVTGSFSGGSIYGASITGGSITSNTKITVTTDLDVGNNINLGSITDWSPKAITFNSDSSITGGVGDLGIGMEIECDDLHIGANSVSFQRNALVYFDDAYISWGGNRPVAVWG
ncbi:phage tail protein [Ureibacillus chungkukjangi]|uniref:phage tail protein n=1 Tax=Ureibacillus chungkukjangi TaxID=1202712 RepID=UPI00204120EA|nr:phage tail protein [Ureibacillus chungkukjangi]MCM3387349.1 phage tail protein [Ureibacillus chungkukjangi]